MVSNLEKLLDTSLLYTNPHSKYARSCYTNTGKNIILPVLMKQERAYLLCGLVSIYPTKNLDIFVPAYLL